MLNAIGIGLQRELVEAVDLLVGPVTPTPAFKLGERVDDTFLIEGAELQHNRAQIAIETELMEALAQD